MDDPSLIRIHGLQEYRLSGASHLGSNVPCKVLQSFFSPSAVVLSVYFYADIGTVSFVYHKAGQILNGIQGLSSFSDQHTHLVTVEINVQGAFLIKGGLDLYLHIHGV